MTIPGIFARAATLGIEPPRYTEADRPEVFECWRDRVLQAESDVSRGVDPAPMIREAAIYGGHPVAPLPMPPALQQYGTKLDDFFKNVIPRLIFEQSKPEGNA